MKEHKARRRLGQNFLQDTCIVADIVNAVRPQTDDMVVEVGPGLAAIIGPLAKKLSRLHVIEIDRDIVGRLKTLSFADKLVIHEGDVLQFDFNGIVGKKKTVGNLPYNIPTLLLFKLAEVANDVVEMYFMLQKEVVERMVATPKSNDCDRSGMMLQYFLDMELLIDVPPESFDPAPEVDSAAVRITPVKHRIGKADDFEHFAKLVKLAFHQRRKTIRNNLKEFAGDEDLQAVSISSQDRVKHIAPERHVGLSNYLVRKAIWKYPETT